MCLMWTDAKFVNIYVNSKEGDMEGEDGPGKLDRIAIVEVLMEKGIMLWVHKNKISINLSQRSGFESSSFRKTFSKNPMKSIA